MSQISMLPENCKFAAIAVQNVRSDLRSELTLQDGTIAVTKIPFPIENHWRTWLGAMQSHNLESCNLFLVSVATSGWPDGQLAIFGGNLDSEQMQCVGGIFAFLRVVGPIEYSDAFMVAGHVENGQAEIRHFARTEHFKITRGSLPWVVRAADLEEASRLSSSYNALLKRFPGERWRFGRGCHALKTAMEQQYASDRLHGFVRALEALIVPDKGNTEKQFVSRCALFAGPATVEAKARSVLLEAYRMRCDVEHVHDWDRSLKSYPGDEREHLAYWRTRQIEELACAVYRKIISDRVLQANFYDDSALQAFWQRPVADLRAAFGNICDITRLKMFRKYDSYGRAHPSEWPKEVFARLTLEKSA
jgi:hypothetical protein